MSKFPSAMCMGLGLLAAVVAAPAYAEPQGGATATPITRVKRIGTRLETVIVSAGAMDRQNERWKDSGGENAVLPVVSESAFLDGEETGAAESRQP